MKSSAIFVIGTLACVALGCTSAAPASPEAQSRDAGVRDAGRSDSADASAVYELPPAWSGHSPVAVATSADAISLAVDDAHVYWQTAGGAVFGCPFGGCPGGKPTLLSSLVGSTSTDLQTLSAASGIATFLTDTGLSISSVAYADPSGPSTTYEGVKASAGTQIAALAADSSNLYFTSNLSTDGGFDVALNSCPWQGGCASPKALFASATSYASSQPSTNLGPIAAQGSVVYFVEVGDTSMIRAVAAQGGTPRTVCTSSMAGELDRVQSIVVAGDYVYFTTSSDPRSIYQCSISVIAAPARYILDYAPYALASDGANLYWTNYVPTTGTVAICAVGATCDSPFTVASHQDAPFALAANATSVYWATPAQVYRADR